MNEKIQAIEVIDGWIAGLISQRNGMRRVLLKLGEGSSFFFFWG